MHFSEQSCTSCGEMGKQKLPVENIRQYCFVCGVNRQKNCLWRKGNKYEVCYPLTVEKHLVENVVSRGKKEHCGEKVGRQFCLWRKGANMRCACATRSLTERCGLASSPPWQTDPDAFASFFTFSSYFLLSAFALFEHISEISILVEDCSSDK